VVERRLERKPVIKFQVARNLLSQESELEWKQQEYRPVAWRKVERRRKSLSVTRRVFGFVYE
jgi:hypothetical protein